MDWYKVVKTINGRRYLYLQKTYRVGRSVKTLNKYIGPYDGSPIGVPSPFVIKHPDLTVAVTRPLPFPSPISHAVDVRDALNALLGPPSRGWSQAWDRSRLKRDGNLVVRDEHVDAMIDNLKVTWSHMDSGCWYSPSDDMVNVPPEYRFDSTSKQTATQAYYVVVFHELVHWTKRRVDRDAFIDVGVGFRGQYAAEELVAELGALTLMKALGKDVGNEQRHAHYFQHWRDQLPERNREAAVEYAKIEAAKAVKYILDHAKVTDHDQRPSAKHIEDASRAYRGQAPAGADRLHDAARLGARAAGDRDNADRAASKLRYPERPLTREERIVIAQERRDVQAERREDERIQYGSLKARKDRQEAQLKTARKLTRHLKPLNYFAAKISLFRKKDK